MKKLRILHAADLHLDSAFEGLSDAAARLRRAEQRELLDKLVSVAAREHIDLVLLCGDLTDGPKLFRETEERLVRALGEMRVPVFISPGNHDPYIPHSCWERLSFPENVHIFRKNTVECVTLEALGARVYGAAYTDSVCPPLLRDFHVEKKAGYTDLLCLHAEVGRRDSPYCPVFEEELAASGLDYAAFGHIHTPGALKKAGRTAYAWCGCPEGRGFDETGERFVYVVESEEENITLRPLSIAKRQYRSVRVDVTGKEVLPAILAALPENTTEDLYRIVLTGEGGTVPENLYAELAGRFFALQLRDDRRAPNGLWDGCGEDSLRGSFLQKLKAIADAAESEEEKKKAESAARWGLAALDRGEEIAVHENQ